MSTRRISFLRAAIALAMGVCLTTTTFALDTITTISGSKLSGTIATITANEVVIDRAGGKKDTVPSDSISYINFDGEPPRLRLARSAVLGGQFEDGIKSLEEIKAEADGADPEILKDIDYFIAYSKARLGLAGGDIKAGEAAMKAFTDDAANKNNFHYYGALELLGNVQVAAGKSADAAKTYQKVLESTSAGFKMRGGVALGYAQLKLNNSAGARTAFQGAKSANNGSEDLKILGFSADLGIATCDAADNKIAPAIQAVHKIIQNAPENGLVYARAYTTLGNCLSKQPGKEKEAMIAFLHVDVLYPGYPAEHAEALYNLSFLWDKLNKGERARTAKATLKARYPGSEWARRATQ